MPERNNSFLRYGAQRSSILWMPAGWPVAARRMHHRVIHRRREHRDAVDRSAVIVRERRSPTASLSRQPLQ